MSTRDPSAIARQLREQIRQIEAPFSSARQRVPTGFAPLDRILPDGGLRRGSLIEWLSDCDGSCAASLALAIATRVLGERSVLVMIDGLGTFNPLAAAELGISMNRMIVIRPDTPSNAWWAWEQSLRCPDVRVTLGWLASLGERVFRRLQLAVQAGGGFGFLLRPIEGKSVSWGTTRLKVQPLPSAGRGLGRCLQVELLRGWGGARRPPAEVELDHETGNVPAISRMAAAAPLLGPPQG